MKLIVLPGDGIGPEIMDATVVALKAADDAFGLDLTLETHRLGLDAIAQDGSALPDAVLDACRAADGTIMGPVDTYAYPPASEGGVNPSAKMRKSLDLYANIRPSRTFAGVPSCADKMDMVVVRENTEGFYADRSMFMGSGEFMPTEDLALSVRKITRGASRRIAVQAFKQAERRRKKVTVVHKANVLKISDGLFLEEVNDVAKSHPGVELEELIIDAATAHLVRRPEEFDVLVTTNMYGDILSDLAAELSGGIGLGGSINANDDVAIAQAAHGAAPDIAGQGAANPTALMVSVGMLLDWLGSKNGHNDLIAAGAAMRDAVTYVLENDAARTPDLGGSATTADIGRTVAERITASAKG